MKTCYKKFGVLFFLILLLSASGFCSMQFRKLSTSDGLSNRRVLSMAKDSKGYYWFATRLAMDRYDGEKFVNYRLSDNEKIRGVIADRKGRMFAFTEKSIYAYNQGSDSFILMSKSKEVCPTSNNATINALYFDAQNNVWIGIAAGLYYSKNFADWHSCKVLQAKSTYSFADASDGSFWVGTSNGVFQVRQSSGNAVFVSPLNDLMAVKNFRIQSLYYDKLAHKLWIGTFSDGLFTYNLSTKKVSKNSQTQVNIPPVRSIANVSDSEVWVGYDGLGIFAYDRFSGLYLRSYTQANEESLGSNSIYHIFKDNTYTWVCSYTDGVFIHDRTKVNFRFITPSSIKAPLNLAESHINSILEDSDGDIWFGTNNGLRVYNPTRHTWQNYLQQVAKGGAANGVILSLYEDRNKNIWVGGFATDLICISKRTKQIKRIDLPASDTYRTTQNYIYSIVEDKQGGIWFGGVISKLTRYDVASGKCRQYDIRGINKIVELNSTTLMLGTVNGAYYFDKRTGTHRRLNLRKLSQNDSVPAYPFINNIVRDEKDPSVVWIGSDGNGLFRYNLSTHAIACYTTSFGLSSNYVYGILFDQLNRLWVSSEFGLNCLSTTKEHSIFTLPGIPENTFNFLAYLKLRNGNMLWGTPRGVVEISPESIKEQNKAAFNLRFSTFYVYYKKVVANADDSPLTDGIDDTKSIVLSYNQRSFSFDFFNISVPATKNIVYSWKLDGFDEDWSRPTSEHKAVYTNIPSGSYTFLVKAINTNNGSESEVRRVEVKVRPPFWASILAYLVYGLLFIGIISLLTKYYRNKVEVQNSEEKINFFVNMAHDIRIPITLIRVPLNEIEHETLSETGQAALKLAQRNTHKLFTMVSQLLDFQKVGLNAVTLHVEETLINPFINEIIYNFILLAKDKGIALSFTPLYQDEKVWIDRQKINMVVENLLSNAIKYTSRGGNVQIKLDVLPMGWLLVEVSDDGIGIPMDAQDMIFSRFFRANNTINSNEVGSGIGLLLTKKLVVLHKGRVSFTSHEKCGTTFKVEVPYLKSAYATSEVIESEFSNSMQPLQESEGDEENKLKILFVEDNDELRVYLSKLLSKEYRVEQASNGEEALVCVKAEAPDFILSDVIMPKMSGVELCAKLKTNIETCHIPIILLSSLTEREDVIKGLKAGAEDYITKPFDLSILDSKIKTILTNRSLFKRKYIDQTAYVDHESYLNVLDKEFMHKVIQIIEGNMSNEEFSIELLSSDLAMSRSVFFKKIKALTGQSPVDLVKDIRMKKAAELLREQRYSVNEIAYLTGFPNPKYFSTAFKKYFGNTPTGFIDKEKF